MLICKNCDSENPAGTIKCGQCNMEGNFIQIGTQGNKNDFLAVEPEQPTCKNCGCKTPGTGTKCVECNFPLPKSPVLPIATNVAPKIQKRTNNVTNHDFHPWEISNNNQKTG